jgi:thiamine kinase-like enzyme
MPYNSRHISTLCSRLDLGSPSEKLSRVYGGFHHEMWRLDTGHGSYAVKQLCSDSDVRNPVTVRHYNSTESIAEAFAGHGIPAIHALQSDSQYLHVIENTGYLVYPWTNAVALGKDQISEQHALEVARIMARMHRANLDMHECRDAQYDVHPEDQVKTLVAQAVEHDVHKAGELMEQLPGFLAILAKLKIVLPIIRQHRVISHGDMDHKNILWNAAGNPAIIDWESARKLNPTHEIVLEALDWSGITAHFQITLFEKMLSAYTAAGGIIESAVLEASFHCVICDWLNWLMYNLGRNIYLENGDPSALGAEQVELTLSTILRLELLIPSLLPIARDQSDLAFTGEGRIPA